MLSRVLVLERANFLPPFLSSLLLYESVQGQSNRAFPQYWLFLFPFFCVCVGGGGGVCAFLAKGTFLLPVSRPSLNRSSFSAGGGGGRGG